MIALYAEAISTVLFHMSGRQDRNLSSSHLERSGSPHDGRELRYIRTESKEQDGYTQTMEVYGCADCSGCGYKSKSL